MPTTYRYNRILRYCVPSLAVTLLTLVFCAYAGEYHKGAQLVCSDCHVAHASVGSQTWTPTEMLLKNSAGEVALCMSCHDGTDPQSPDIVSTGTAANPNHTISTSYTSKYGSSAGYFQSDYATASNPCGHSLQANIMVTAPLSTNYSKSGGMVCSDCHDPHGNSNYRNLLPNPNPNSPASLSILIGTQIAEAVPVNTAAPNPAQAYDSGNIALYTESNVSSWCSNCHNQLSQNTAGTAPAHFKGHPSDVPIGGIGAYTDISNWQSGFQGPTTGFGIDIGDATPGIPRVRYGSTSGSNTVTGSGDTLNCLSCHKAHGSRYKHGLLWPYYEGGADSLSGCQQCHFK